MENNSKFDKWEKVFMTALTLVLAVSTTFLITERSEKVAANDTLKIKQKLMQKKLDSVDNLYTDFYYKNQRFEKKVLSNENIMFSQTKIDSVKTQILKDTTIK